jgi:hypothetical protein
MFRPGFGAVLSGADAKTWLFALHQLLDLYNLIVAMFTHCCMNHRMYQEKKN